MPDSARDDRCIDGGFVRVAPLEDLKAKGMMVVPGERCPLLVVHDDGKVFALDNRCPHLGFPLHRGSVEHGILTCHWHHARFDLASGGTFDPWADDVPTAPAEIRDGVVWVARRTGYADGEAHWHNRLRQGMEQDIALVIAKAVLGLTGQGVDYQTLVCEAALFGVRNRDGWGVGLTILTALANLVPSLPGEQVYLSLYQGIRRTANDCDGAAPRRDRHPLDGGERSMATLGRWLRHWTRVRHREGAERTVLTAIAAGASPGELCELMLIAVTDRYFADGGHALDFLNKAFECLEIIGWEHAAAVLPTVVDQMVSARGGEELNAWRHPTDLVPLCEAAFADLPAALAVGERRRGGWRDHAGLAHGMLGDDPATIIGAIRSAVRAGATATDLSRALAYAAALRVAWFGTSNEFSDWVTAHHCFTYCNALHQSLKRIEGTRPAGGQLCPEVLRGIFHGAMRVYLNRFLNVPPARLPRPDNGALDDLPSDPEALCKRFLSALDRQGEVTTAARIVASYAALDHPIEPLIVALVHAVLREDSAFHTYQMLEAGVRQYRDWGRTEEGRNILIAVARYLAAHSPTERAQLQTATVARRLSRGESVHDPEPADGPQ